MNLNSPSINYKVFPEEGTAPNTKQLPLLIAEGRTPLSVAGFMRRYLEVLSLNVPESLKPEYGASLEALEDNLFDTGDGAVRHSDGRMKIVTDAPYIRLLTPDTKLVDGAVNLSDIYKSISACELSKKQVDKYCGKPQGRNEAKQNPIWLALAQEDKTLLAEFVDARFTRTKERFNYDGKMMGVHAPSAPGSGALGRLWCVLRLDGGIGSSRAIGYGHLGYGSGGRLVGVAPEAQRIAPQLRQTLEQKV